MTNPQIVNVSTLSRSEFLERGIRDIIRADTPLLIDWSEPIAEEQVVSHLLHELADAPVALFRKPANPETKSRSEVTGIQLAAFFNTPSFRNSDDGFVHRVVTNIKNNPDLIEALLGRSPCGLFEFSGNRDFVNIWINHRGQFGRAHFDELENFNLQLAGAKRFVLAPPNRRNYYVRSLLKGFGHHSAFANMLEVDIARFPRFAGEIAKLQEAVVRPGQMLYIPIGWWHQVHPIGQLNINMNFWLFDPKLFRRPYVLADAIYKEYFRKLLKRYDYQPEAPAAAGIAAS